MHVLCIEKCIFNNILTNVYVPCACVLSIILLENKCTVFLIQFLNAIFCVLYYFINIMHILSNILSNFGLKTERRVRYQELVPIVALIRMFI